MDQPRTAERRARRRAPCAVDLTVRPRGRFIVAAASADLTPNGCRLAGAGPFAAGSELRVCLPGIESQPARVVWSVGATTGIAFARPLPSADFARLLPETERFALVGDA